MDCTSESKYLIEQNQCVTFVGLVCLDILNIVEHFPVEDLSVRCKDCRWQRGGNASNSATVFALLGGKTGFFGTLADSDEMTFLIKDFDKYHIDYDKCPRILNSACPLSVVIISRSSGTRTVLHTNLNLRELTLHDFKTQLDFKSTGWLHIETRDNGFNICEMLKYMEDFNETCLSDANSKRKPIVVSMEVEKLRIATAMEEYNLWRFPDVVFVSKDFAKSQGYQNMTDTAQYYFEKLKKGAIVVCAWGEQGAAAMSAEDGLVMSPAFPPPEIIDSCGAGDTFNAAVIRALSTGKTLRDAIIFGCKIAGAKCGFLGYDGVEKLR